MGDHRADGYKIGPALPLGNGEQGLLGLIQRRIQFGLLGVAERGDGAACLDESPQCGGARDVFGVIPDMDSCRHLGHEVTEGHESADKIEVRPLPQFTRDRDQVRGYPAVQTGKHRIVHQGVLFQIKVIRMEGWADTEDRLAIHQDGAKDGALGSHIKGNTAVNHRNLLSGAQTRELEIWEEHLFQQAP